MHARAALPLLLLCTFPARGDDVPREPGECARQQRDGAECFNGSVPGRCGRTTCTQELDGGEDGELREYECYVCMDLAQYAHYRHEHALELRYRAHAGPINLALGVLSAGGLATLAWWRRRRRARGPRDSFP